MTTEGTKSDRRTGIQQTSPVASYEANSVEISCYSNVDEPMEWLADTKFLMRLNKFRMYGVHGSLMKYFAEDGRYSVNEERINISNTTIHRMSTLTIVNLTLSDMGEYACDEKGGLGLRTSVILRVLGKSHHCVPEN